MACMQQSRKSCTADWGSEMRHERIGYYILNGRIAQYAPGKWTVHGRQKSRTLHEPRWQIYPRGHSRSDPSSLALPEAA